LDGQEDLKVEIPALMIVEAVKKEMCESNFASTVPIMLFELVQLSGCALLLLSDSTDH